MRTSRPVFQNLPGAARGCVVAHAQMYLRFFFVAWLRGDSEKRFASSVSAKHRFASDIIEEAPCGDLLRAATGAGENYSRITSIIPTPVFSDPIFPLLLLAVFRLCSGTSLLRRVHATPCDGWKDLLSIRRRYATHTHTSQAAPFGGGETVSPGQDHSAREGRKRRASVVVLSLRLRRDVRSTGVLATRTGE